MNLQQRVKAVTKVFAGRMQEVAGRLTGNRRKQLQGQAKQVEAAAHQVKENVKDALKQGIDRL
jgi:uncharacterized protein YjbJ (UPF0337 family)